METLNFIFNTVEDQIGFGVWALRSFSLLPSLALFLVSAGLFIVGSIQLKKLFAEKTWIGIPDGYTRSAHRFGHYYKIVTLIFLQALWLYSLVVSFVSVLTADPF